MPATNLLLPASAMTTAWPDPPVSVTELAPDELDLAGPGAERDGGGIAAAEHEGVAADRVGAGLREVLLQRPVIARLGDRGRRAAGDRERLGTATLISAALWLVLVPL